MSYYKENQKITEHNERVLKDINNFAEYINGDLALKYSIEECQLLQPLVMLLCRYIMYSGLYDDVVFHLETASDIREVVKNARAYFIETSFFLLHSEEPISQRMEQDLINFVFFSIESAGLEHVEKRQPTFEEIKEDPKTFEQAYESEQITQQIIKEIEVGIGTCDTLNDV